MSVLVSIVTYTSVLLINILSHCYTQLDVDYVEFQRKEEDRRQAELSGCAVDTRHRPSSPPLRTPELQAPTVNHFTWYF